MIDQGQLSNLLDLLKLTGAGSDKKPPPALPIPFISRHKVPSIDPSQGPYDIDPGFPWQTPWGGPMPKS